MKSRREYYESRKMLMIGSRIFYGISAILFFIALASKSGFATIAVIIALLMLGGVMCSLYAGRQKDYLFCPKCGSKNIVKKGFSGVPSTIAEECPDCHAKLDLDKPVNKD